MRLLLRLRGFLTRPHAVWWTVVLAVVLSLPALLTGRIIDDHAHHMMLDARPGMERAPHELYSFLPDDPEWRAARQEQGVLPWYADAEVRATFWRPLSSLTLYLDHLLAPDWYVLAHLHSILWLAGLVGVMALVYRRLLTPAWVAALATLLLAVDDAHGLTVAWVANRHALVAMLFSGLALLTHLRWRQDGCRTSAVLAPLLLAAALLSSELSLCICAYLFAYAVLVEAGTLKRRLVSLLPSALVCVIWRAAYVAQGHGPQASDLYLDPAREPLRFLVTVAERWPVLIQAQLTFVSSDTVLFHPPVFGMLFVGGALVVAFGLLAICWQLLRADRLARFWAAGLALSALPVCTVFPHDRLLLPLSLGGFGLVAHLLGRLSEASSESEDGYWRRGSVRALGGFWIAVHLVIAPLLLPVRSYSARWFGAPFEAAARSLDRVGELGGRTLVFVNGPDFFFTSWAPLIRQSLGLSVPARLRILGTTMGSVQVTRVDPRTLRLSAPQGYLTAPLDAILRSRTRPFRVGQKHVLSDFWLEVTAVTEDSRPAEVICRFAKVLEDESMLWVAWSKNGYQRFELPAVGSTVTLPGCSLLDLIMLR